MKLVKHPKPESALLQRYNDGIENGWRSGLFGVAFDVWDTYTERHLFRSYSLEDAEPLADWEFRNGIQKWRWCPAPWVEHSEFTPMIPYPVACTRTLTSLQNIADILSANYLIAIEDNPPRINGADGNNLRQMLHHEKTKRNRLFCVRHWYDDRNQFSIRAAIARKECDSFDIPHRLAQAG